MSYEEDGQPAGVNMKAKLIHSGVQTGGGRMVQSKRGKQACYGQTIWVRPQAPAGVAGKGRSAAGEGSWRRKEKEETTRGWKTTFRQVRQGCTLSDGKVSNLAISFFSPLNL